MRQSKAQLAVSNVLNQPLAPTAIPSIGVACSGGSFRAALATIGLMRGLTAIGLMDAVTYWAALSGSTWATAAWIYHNMDLNAFTSFMQHALDNNNAHDNLDEEEIIETMSRKFGSGRPYSANDIWGSVIANIVLGTDTTDGQEVLFSSLAPRVVNGAYPIPLFTSIIGETSSNYQWFEISPFLAGSTYLNTWIPTTAFGKKFDAGKSTDPLPEENLGFVMGMCGSAYAVSLSDIIQNLGEMVAASCGSCGCWATQGKRISPPVINNFTYNLQGAPLSSKKTLTLVDAGIETNLPFPPLMRRNVQFYIVCDASSDNDSAIGNEMREVEAWAKKNGYAFPPVDYKRLTQQQISILAAPNAPQTPVIVYIPNKEAFSTLKFSYSKSEFDRLVGGIENTVISNAKQIYQALGFAVSNKQTLARQKRMAKVK